MIDGTKLELGQFKPIVIDDIYKVRDWKSGQLDFIFDIGANIGIFSILMRTLHPNAKIIAVEPLKEVTSKLRNNLSLFDVVIEEIAFGDGSDLCLLERNSTIDHIFTSETLAETYTVNSISLINLFKKHGCKLTDSYLIKLDCEGGESSIIGDKDSEEVLKNAKQVSMEIHFKTAQTNFDSWLNFQDYENWINKLFKDTHSIEYYNSSKRRGYGHYCIRKIERIQPTLSRNEMNAHPWIIIDRLSDVVLAHVEGCVVEIGAGHSSFTLSKHAQAFNRKFYTCDSSWKTCDWVEAQPEIVFDKLIVYRGKSSAFITEFDDVPAIVFVDGNHRIKNVIKEFEFFIEKLAIGGIMFFHDTCPMEGYYERKLEKKGRAMTTWQLKSYLKKRDDIEVFTWPYTAATCGLTMVLKKDMSAPLYRL